MSLIRAVTIGTLIGVATAVGIFAAAGPDDLGRVAAPAAPTFAPVPTPTVTQLADCEKPAVLKKGICVTTKPGPKITIAAPSSGGGSTTSAPRTAPRTAPAPAPAATHEDQDEHEDEDEDEHEDEHHDEHEDEHQDDHDDD